MCRQAKDRGTLQGDLHYVQMLALRIASQSERYDSWEQEKRLYKKLDMLLDGWLSFEHPEIWSEVDKRRKRDEEEKDSAFNAAELSADNMTKLMELMRKAAVANDGQTK